MIFGCKREKVTGGWRKLLTEELHKFYFSPSPDIISVVKSRRVRLVGHVACMGEMISGRKADRKRSVQRFDADDRKILK